MTGRYGVELILDLHGCKTVTFTRGSISEYFRQLCKLIDMERCDLHFWDDLDTPDGEKQTLPHTQGTSAVQFILTSSIVVHTLDQLNAAYINIFSCKDFDAAVAERFSAQWFGAKACRAQLIERV